MAVNNNGNLLDTSGNVAVDFVWGNFPMQPNDDRTDGTPVVALAANASENKSWSGYSVYPSARLNAGYDSHAIAEAEWANYPSFIAAEPNYMVSAVSGDGTTVTYTCQNYYNGGETVNITGLTASAYNLSGVTIASRTKTSFTVTNSANAGLITGQRGKVESTTALTAADGFGINSGVPYIQVPAVLGKTTALAIDALKDAGYESANITTATAATNAASTITAVSRTGTAATITSTGSGAKYPVGTKITVASLVSPNTDLNGTWTVTAVATDTVSFTTTTSGALSTTGLSVAGLTGVSGTIKSQSTAANAASVATTATITITPFA
jgi:hypothetical protein